LHRVLATPQEARATLEATLAIEHSIAVGNLVMLPPASALPDFKLPAAL
jgi:hypothetical protein